MKRRKKIRCVKKAQQIVDRINEWAEESEGTDEALAPETRELLASIGNQLEELRTSLKKHKAPPAESDSPPVPALDEQTMGAMRPI